MYHQETEFQECRSEEPFDCSWTEQSFRPCQGRGEREEIQPAVEGQVIELVIRCDESGFSTRQNFKAVSRNGALVFTPIDEVTIEFCPS